MTTPLADQLTAFALYAERNNGALTKTGCKRLRDLAEQVRALESREQARLSAGAFGSGSSRGEQGDCPHGYYLGKNCRACDERPLQHIVAGPIGENDLD